MITPLMIISMAPMMVTHVSDSPCIDHANMTPKTISKYVNIEASLAWICLMPQKKRPNQHIHISHAYMLAMII